MLKYRVERLREILDPNYKLELPEQLTEGTGEPKTIIRSNDFIINPARGFCEIVTEPDEDGTGTKISFKNPTYNKDLPGYGTFGRDKDGKEVLKHNKKAFTNPTKWGIDDANKLRKSAATSPDGPSPRTPQQATSQPQPSTSSTLTKTTKRYSGQPSE